MIPNIIKTDTCFEGNILLESWNTYWNTSMELKLNIGGDDITNYITQIHENGYKYLIDKQNDILKSIINSVYKNYAVWQLRYSYDDIENNKFMPDINKDNDLTQLIFPKKIYIMNIEKENIPYIGVEMSCTWDIEHGLGLMLYKTDVISIGGADNAFMSWIEE